MNKRISFLSKEELKKREDPVYETFSEKEKQEYKSAIIDLFYFRPIQEGTSPRVKQHILKTASFLIKL